MTVSLVVPLAILILIGGIAAVVVFLTTRLRAGQPVELSFRAVLVTYFYSMSIASLIVTSVGLTDLVKAGLSQPFGRGFSYYIPIMPLPMSTPPITKDLGPSAPVVSPDQQQAEQERGLQQAERQYRGDVVQGWTLAIAGTIVWALHLWGRRKVVRRDDGLSVFMSRAHLTMLLLLFGVVGLISLATGIYQALQFGLVPIEPSAPGQPPGEAAAMAIVYVPFWVGTLAIALRELRREAE